MIPEKQLVKPIETIYNGYRFRSRLEARWAVFFDAIGIKYEYEKEGFDLGELGRYLPDFFVPIDESGCGWFVEVKGPIEKGLEKAIYLDNYPPEYALGCLIVRQLQYAKTESYEDSPTSYNHIALLAQMLTNRDITDDEINFAIDRAKQARFEHGECG